MKTRKTATFDRAASKTEDNSPRKDAAEEFLKHFLSGGPILRTNVFRESENAGLLWEDVRNAFARINGREYVQRGEIFWRWVPD